MTRLLLGVLLALQVPAFPQQKRPDPVVEEPPEEDKAIAPKEYSFNPLQSEKEITVGNYYFKKGSYKAALHRFQEASKWNPGNAEAYLRMGDTELKLKQKKAAKEAYSKFVELAPDHKEAGAIKDKLKKL